MDGQSLTLINIDNNIIENKEYIKILGTFIHNSFMFNYNFQNFQNSLLIQLKRRENTIINIKKYLSNKMLKIVSNAIIFGKINYHLLIWPLINNGNINKVNKIIENISRIVYGYDSYGRTFEYLLKE